MANFFGMMVGKKLAVVVIELGCIVNLQFYSRFRQGAVKRFDWRKLGTLNHIFHRAEILIRKDGLFFNNFPLIQVTGEIAWCREVQTIVENYFRSTDGEIPSASFQDIWKLSSFFFQSMDKRWKNHRVVEFS